MRRLNVFAALLTVSTTLAVLVGAVGAVTLDLGPVEQGNPVLVHVIAIRTGEDLAGQGLSEDA